MSKHKGSSASVFTPGAVRPRPAKGRSQAHAGVSPLHPVSHRNTSFQPLPRPLGLPPYRYDISEAFPDIGKAIADAGRMTFHVVGDTGGVQDGEFQSNVAEQMIDHLDHAQGDKPLFCYHVGDVVYFTGAHDDYYAQFYEPYAHYDAPIFSIPGNHDGEVDDPTQGPSLGGWVAYFMQEHPDVDPIAKDAPRVQLNLPNPYWTLITPVATIVGMYTNVPEGGSIDSVQQQWLTNEFAEADPTLPLILALVLRSLIAPLYLIASVVLSYLASLGFAVIVFMEIGGQSGLIYFLPFMLFLFLLALGEDYNILVMTRIREEAKTLPLKQAVIRAIGTTGTTVTSAGLVLAGTFVVFGIVIGASGGSGSSAFNAVAYGLAAGILMDTFVVRTVLVPSVVVLLGRWNWWPSKVAASTLVHDEVVQGGAN